MPQPPPRPTLAAGAAASSATRRRPCYRCAVSAAAAAAVSAGVAVHAALLVGHAQRRVRGGARRCRHHCQHRVPQPLELRMCRLEVEDQQGAERHKQRSTDITHDVFQSCLACDTACSATHAARPPRPPQCAGRPAGPSAPSHEPPRAAARTPPGAPTPPPAAAAGRSPGAATPRGPPARGGASRLPPAGVSPAEEGTDGAWCGVKGGGGRPSAQDPFSQQRHRHRHTIRCAMPRARSRLLGPSLRPAGPGQPRPTSSLVSSLSRRSAASMLNTPRAIAPHAAGLSRHEATRSCAIATCRGPSTGGGAPTTEVGGPRSQSGGVAARPQHPGPPAPPRADPARCRAPRRPTSGPSLTAVKRGVSSGRTSRWAWSLFGSLCLSWSKGKQPKKVTKSMMPSAHTCTRGQRRQGGEEV